MNTLLHNRAILSAPTRNSSNESLEQRVAKLEELVSHRRARNMDSPAVKAQPRLDVDQMAREANAKVARMTALQRKIFNQVAGGKAA